MSDTAWHASIIEMQQEHREKLFKLSEGTRSVPNANQDPIEVHKKEIDRIKLVAS